MRIDKFLWCTRLCKTRGLAAEECAKGRVRVGEREVKASLEVHVGDVISVRQPPIWRMFAVKAIPASRVGAKLVPELLEERTSMEEREKAELARTVRSDERLSGTGRPTKRDRRDRDRMFGE